MTAAILVVDDDEAKARSVLADIADRVEVVHPEHFEVDQVLHARLVLVDHHLADGDWPERGTRPASCQPKDGLALAEVIRSHLRQHSGQPPTAIAVLSAQLEEVVPGWSGDPPEHLAAQASGLMWAFSKSERVDHLSGRVIALCEAVEQLPKRWPEDYDAVTSRVRELLNLEDQEWSDAAMRQVADCHPPIHALATWTDGLAFLSWLLQRIVPYPTFLRSAKHVALRLSVTPEWFASAIVGGEPLEKVLQPAMYRGVLEGFSTPRWWLAGVEDILWQALQAESGNVEAVHEWVADICGSRPKALGADYTLALNERLRFGGEAAPFRDCVRLEPDDWPAYADPPYTTIDLANADARLRTLVVSSDRERLEVETG